MRSLFLTAGVALALGTPATAQQSGAAAPKAITRSQLTTNLDAAFRELDSNKDGSVSVAEMQAARTKELQQIEGVRSARIQQEFNKFDTNKDGQLSPREFAAGFPGINAPETPAQVVQALDSNKDGKVSAEEFRAPRIAAFNKVDANKDGTVTPQEMQAVSRR